MEFRVVGRGVCQRASAHIAALIIAGNMIDPLARHDRLHRQREARAHDIYASAGLQYRLGFARRNFAAADHDTVAAGYVEEYRNVSHETPAILIHDGVMRQSRSSDAPPA